MKTLPHYFFLLLILGFTHISVLPQAIRESYDRFKGIKTVRTKTVITGIQNGSYALLAANADTTENGQTTFSLLVGCRTILAAEYSPTVILLINNERVLLGRIPRCTTNSNESDGYYPLNTSLEIISKISSSARTEMQIGSREFLFDSELTTVFANFLERLRSPKRSTPISRREDLTSSQFLPSENEIEGLVQRVIQDFADGVESGSFEKIHSLLSKSMKKQTSVQSLASNFSDFVAQKGAIVPVLRSTAYLFPTYSPQPSLDGKELKISGIYNSVPNLTEFEIVFYSENKKWMLSKIAMTTK